LFHFTKRSFIDKYRLKWRTVLRNIKEEHFYERERRRRKRRSIRREREVQMVKKEERKE